MNVSTFDNFRVLTKLDHSAVGGFIRSKDNIKIDIFIVYKTGDIKKYDQKGNLQLTIIN
jgi:hypothetical protein